MKAISREEQLERLRRRYEGRGAERKSRMLCEQYQRLLKMDLLRTERKRALRDQFESLDPFELHDRLEKSLRPILTMALEVN